MRTLALFGKNGMLQRLAVNTLGRMGAMRIILSVALSVFVCALPAAAENAPLLREPGNGQATVSDEVSEAPTLADSQIEDRVRTILRRSLRTCWRVPSMLSIRVGLS